jgi:hypothetical protein
MRHTVAYAFTDCCTDCCTESGAKYSTNCSTDGNADSCLSYGLSADSRQHQDLLIVFSRHLRRRNR